MTDNITDGFGFTVPKKKGNSSWLPHDLLRLPDEAKNPNLHYRWVMMDDTQIQRRQSQGYVLANSESGGNVAGYVNPRDSNVGGSPTAGGDLVLMATLKEAHEAYQQHTHGKADEMERGINRENAGGAPINPHTGRAAEARQRLVIE